MTAASGENPFYTTVGELFPSTNPKTGMAGPETDADFTLRKVGLSNVTVFDHKVVSRSFSKPVQAVITRALETIDKTCLRTSACLVKGGELILMKGPSVDEELRDVLKRFKNHFRLKEDMSYTLPYTPFERRLIVLEKLSDPVIPKQNEAANEGAHGSGPYTR